MAGTVEAGQLLDVDVEELARARVLVAVRRLERLEPRALAEADPLQDRGDGRERHRQDRGDLGGRHPQPPQQLDRPHPLGGRPPRDPSRGRGTIAQTSSPLGPIAGHLNAVRSLTPAASAAAATVHPCSHTRWAINKRECTQVRALP
jgi:hypothetical protein